MWKTACIISLTQHLQKPNTRNCWTLFTTGIEYHTHSQFPLIFWPPLFIKVKQTKELDILPNKMKQKLAKASYHWGLFQIVCFFCKYLVSKTVCFFFKYLVSKTMSFFVLKLGHEKEGCQNIQINCWIFCL